MEGELCRFGECADADEDQDRQVVFVCPQLGAALDNFGEPPCAGDLRQENNSGQQEEPAEYSDQHRL